MCEECRRSPCHNRCPNAIHRAVFICSGSGSDIYEGEVYWDLLGEQFSEECIQEAKEEAETAFICYSCEELIPEGNDCWTIMGEQFCEQCISEARKEARFCEDEW